MLCDVSVSTLSRDDGGRDAMIQVVGELDIATIPDFRSATRRVAAGNFDRVTVDLLACSFIDSAALGVLLGLARRARPGGLKVLAVGRSTAGLIRATGVADLVGLDETAAPDDDGVPREAPPS